MKKYLIYISFLFLFFACKREEKSFDSTTWQAIDGNNFQELREPMVNDLMKNHLYKGMFYFQIIKLLGRPEIFGDKEKNEIGYIIYLKIDGIDDVAGTDLIVKLNNDSTVKSYELVEWKK